MSELQFYTLYGSLKYYSVHVHHYVNANIFACNLSAVNSGSIFGKPPRKINGVFYLVSCFINCSRLGRKIVPLFDLFW